MALHTESLRDQACLIVHGPDQPGIVAAVAALVTRNRGNIVSLDQYSSDPSSGDFFQRVVFNRPDLSAAMPEIEADLAGTLTPLGLAWTLTDRSIPKRMAILVSTSDHCLLELLWRHRRGELPVTIPMVISNHTNTAEDVRSFGVPFFHVPSAGTDKAAAEAQILKLLEGNVDFVVLARYMQILSPGFLDAVSVPLINIHHSFLPAFVGAAPYRKAKDRGVKLEDYLQVTTLEEYLIVSHARNELELWTRTVDGWTRRLATTGTLRLGSGAVIDVDRLYEALPP